MSTFKYDVVTLIELVESKPCIWDKTNEHNKNKTKREKSWQEIFQCLEEDYDQLPQLEKKKIGEAIMAKWCNLRDAFLRSLRTKNGQGEKKQYKYGEHLQFLSKSARKDNPEGYFNKCCLEDDSAEYSDLTEQQLPKPNMQKEYVSESDELHQNFKKRRTEDLECLVEPCAGSTSCSHNQLSDHEILLLSFLAYVRDMTEAELMDFQMEVLMVIRKIKERRMQI